MMSGSDKDTPIWLDELPFEIPKRTNDRVGTWTVYNVNVIYDIKYQGRRLVVVKHDTVFNQWYCGYMQLLPTDKNYWSSNTINYHYYLEDYSRAIGGITYAGDLPQKQLRDGNSYVGFFTDHGYDEPPTAEDTLRALKQMVTIDQRVINEN